MLVAVSNCSGLSEIGRIFGGCVGQNAELRPGETALVCVIVDLAGLNTE